MKYQGKKLKPGNLETENNVALKMNLSFINSKNFPLYIILEIFALFLILKSLHYIINSLIYIYILCIPLSLLLHGYSFAKRKICLEKDKQHRVIFHFRILIKR